MNQKVRVRLPSDTLAATGGNYTSVLLGEQAASKTAARGSTPRARAELARGCAGPHISFRSCWTRFDSWTGCLTDTSSECAGFASDFAKVVDQVRFLARTLLPRCLAAGGRYDAGARRYGDCLQSSVQWVRLPPASFRSQRLVRCDDITFKRDPAGTSGAHPTFSRLR